MTETRTVWIKPLAAFKGKHFGTRYLRFLAERALDVADVIDRDDEEGAEQAELIMRHLQSAVAGLAGYGVHSLTDIKPETRAVALIHDFLDARRDIESLKKVHEELEREAARELLSGSDSEADTGDEDEDEETSEGDVAGEYFASMDYIWDRSWIEKRGERSEPGSAAEPTSEEHATAGLIAALSLYCPALVYTAQERSASQRDWRLLCEAVTTALNVRGEESFQLAVFRVCDRLGLAPEALRDEDIIGGTKQRTFVARQLRRTRVANSVVEKVWDPEVQTRADDAEANVAEDDLAADGGPEKGKTWPKVFFMPGRVGSPIYDYELTVGSAVPGGDGHGWLRFTGSMESEPKRRMKEW